MSYCYTEVIVAITPSIALTSNAKYIPPMSKVYYDPWTDMWLYPGYTGFNYPFQHPFGPEVLKAWNLETSNPDSFGTSYSL